MKAKRFFAMLGVSFAMVLGAVGALKYSGNIKEAKAAPTTVYCKCAQSWWKADGAAVAVHYWGGTSASTTWPGIRMTAVSGETDVWQYDVPDDITGLIFVRVNSSGAIDDWGAKTSNLTLPTDDKDLYTITSTSAVWGEPGVAGEWSKFAPSDPGDPVDPVYSLIGDFNDWADDLDMTLNAGVATYSDLSLNSGEELKIRVNHVWDFNYGYSDLTAASLAYFNNGTSGNLQAKADGLYSFSFDTSTSKITVTFTPVDPVYQVSVGGGSPVTLVKGSSFTYDTDKTGWDYTATISGTADQLVTFTRNSVAIEPGASGLTNNLRYNDSTHALNVEQTFSNQTLTLKVYGSGYDALLDGYTADNQTFYFTNNQSWTNVYLYAFMDNYRQNDVWPGVELTTPVDIDGDEHERYSFTLDVNKFEYVILNNFDGAQTVNIELAAKTANGIYPDTLNGESKWTVGEYTYASVVKSLLVNDVAVALSPSSTEDPDVAVQWETDTLSLQAGHVIKYMVDGVEKTATLQPYGLNNGKVVDGAKQVLVNATAKIYVKEMVAGGVQIFVMGIHNLSQGYHILMNENQIIELADSGVTPDGFTGQTVSEAVTFHKNDSFRLIDTNHNDSLPVPFSPARFDEYSDGGFSLTAGKVVYSGNENFTAAIYLKLLDGNDMVYVGASDPDVAAAKTFAENFMDDIGGVCKMDGSTNQGQLEAMWDEQAEAYALLSTIAKAELADGDHSTVQEIQDFYEMYCEVYRLRKLISGWDLADFLDLKLSLAQPMNPIFNNNNQLLIFVGVAFAMTIAGAGLYLFLKKRKTN